MSFIDILASIARLLPEVKVADRPVPLKEKVVWTLSALIIFFVMYNVSAFGFQGGNISTDFLQVITASKMGSLLTVGIGPIVLASIFLQLFKGAGLINLDLSDTNQRRKFHEAQKVFALVLALVEAGIFTYTMHTAGYLVSDSPIILAAVVAQIAFGAIVLFYLDELISKYGIGSGISLFIAAGVSMAIIGGLMNLIFNPTSGAINSLISGGAEGIPNALLILLPFIFTLVVFFTCVYAEGTKVEIPVAYEQARGLVRNIPLKFFYVSNVPVIFASALLMNIQLFAVPIVGFIGGFDIMVGGYNIADYLGVVDSSNRLYDGLLYYVTPVHGLASTQAHFNFLQSLTPLFHIPQWIHALIYVLFLTIASIFFGSFWAEMQGMDAKSVAGQLGSAGLQLPGFRRDPRMVEKVLDKHIGPLIIVSSAAVGLLAGAADLTGALGTGTGILLTVGIIYRLYEDFEKQNLFTLYPNLSRMF
ncbi:preprotein translocase subunit SecY [Candidatus Micrarchaeota archaeon]|nr:preprotein translocase subunit SecY [Candidatus Micrarchaeota archaeon]